MPDVHALGLKTAQGLIFTETFYWDLNDGPAPGPSASRRPTAASIPTMVQAGVYAGGAALPEGGRGAKTDDGGKVSPR
jgi:branched-chain amino acid transport system substrate-binding protein